MRVIYVAGPFTAQNAWRRAQNIRAAEEVGYHVQAAGAMPLIPHANTANFDGIGTAEFWYEGTLELLKRSDALILVPGWEASKGTQREVAWARANGMPVFETIVELKAWLAAFVCPTCGPVLVDEDGCCKLCGADTAIS